jgi:hypothetical protein
LSLENKVLLHRLITHVTNKGKEAEQNLLHTTSYTACEQAYDPIQYEANFAAPLSPY